MKKQGILMLVALVAIIALSSCNKYEAKTAKLENQNDSLNYTLGLANGDGIKNYYMQNDSSDKKLIALVEALEKAYKSNNTDAMYKLGLEVGTSLQAQKAKGLFGDSTLTFDEKMVKQGLVNSLNKFGEGMTAQQAQEYIQTTMMKIQQAKMAQQAVIQQLPSGPSAPQEAAPQPAN